jgi:hypothetical protein
MPTVYYPKLSLLLPLDALPEALGFVKDGIENLLSGLYFRDFEQGRSSRGDAANYSLIIVSSKLLEVEVPGTGIFLELNPGHQPGSRSEFPVTLRYEWGILGWVRQFHLESFGFSPADFYQLALTATGLTERQLLDRALGVFVTGATPLDQVNKLLADVSSAYSTAITPTDPASTDPLGDALTKIESVIGQGASIVVFVTYILDNLDLAGTEVRLEAFLGGLFGGSLKSYFEKLITPRIDATLQIGAAIRFPRNILIPLDAIGGNPLDDPAASKLTFDAGTFAFSTEEGIGYDETLTASLTPSQIGSTGFQIEITGARLDLSRTTNIPEATADGRPVDFVGVFIDEAAITLPPFFNQDPGSSARLIGRKILAGTGGLSGTIALEAVNPSSTEPALVGAKFGSGFEIALSAVSVSFRQNTITASDIRGSMKIPGFKDSKGNDAEIQINVHIGSDGSFKVTATDDQGIPALSIPGVLDIEIYSLSVERKDHRFSATIVGTLEFDPSGPMGQFLPDKIEIKKLTIWDDGQIELEGGKLTLPRAISLSVGPVHLSVTALGFGAHEQQFDGHLRQYKYFTFDGAIDVSPGGVDASGSGIAFYYTVDNSALLQPDRFMRIQSITVDMLIPGSASPDDAALILHGYLSMAAAQPPSTGTEYAGSISFLLPQLEMGGSASMRLNPSVPSFLIDVGLELSTPILLGATGLGIWDFRAILGLKYVASRQQVLGDDSAPWWKYYKAKIASDYQEGIWISKFAQTSGFSLGAGVSLATAPDSGIAFSSKIFFLLSLPEVFLLQGQGQILKERIRLTDTNDPPFFALIAITNTSIEAAFGVKYLIPAEDPSPGGIATIDALIQMGFFWGSSSAWYIDIGKETPASERVSARLLSIIDAYFYFMMSNAGIRAGAGASYHLSKKFGPLKAELSAYLDTAGHISFRPRQIGGSIRIGGSVDLSIFGFGFGISAAASLAAEGTKPFAVAGSLEVCVHVLRKDRCAKFEFSWLFETALNASENALLKASLADSGKALNMHTQETYELWTGTSPPAPANLDAYMIPLDSYIDIEFMKGVNPSASVINAFGGNAMGSDYIELVPPQRGKSDRVRHEYTLDSVEILYHDGTGWKPYDIYAAATPSQLVPFITTNLSTLKQGYWQYQQPKLHNKLRVMAQSPLSYASQGSGNPVVEDSGITVESIFCAPKPVPRTCIGFNDLAPGGGAPVHLPEGQQFFHHPFQIRFTGGDGSVVDHTPDGGGPAVWVDAGTTIELYPIEPAVSVHLTLSIGTDTAVVHFYRQVAVPPSRPGLDPTQFTYVLIVTKPVTRGAPVDVAYDDVAHPIHKIVIEAGETSVDPPLSCETAVSAEGRDLERFLDALVRRGELLSLNSVLCAGANGDWDAGFIDTSPPSSMSPPLPWSPPGLGSPPSYGSPPGHWSPPYGSPPWHGSPPHGSPPWHGSPPHGSPPWHRSPPHGSPPWHGSPPSHRSPPLGRDCVHYTVLSFSDTELHGIITDWLGRPCPIDLTLIAGALSIDWDRVARVHALRPDVEPPVAGANVTFLIDAEVVTEAGSQQVTLRGSSCHPIIHCEVAANSLPGPLTAAVLALGDLLEILAVANRLVQPRVKLSPEEIAVFDRAFSHPGALPGATRKVWLTTTVVAGPPPRLEATFYDDGTDDTVSLELPWPRDTFSFDEVTGFSGLRPDGVRLTDGPNSGFLIDALVSRPNGESTVTLRGEAPFVVTTGSPVKPPRGTDGKPSENGGVYFHEICVLDYPTAAFNATLPTQSSVDAEAATIVNAFQGSIQPLWRPYTHYAIHVTTTDQLYQESNSGSSSLAIHTNQAFFGFSTVGPLGFFHIYTDSSGAQVPRPDYAALEAAGHGDEFKLIGLLHYLDFDKCYPNVNGQLINAKPLFYASPSLLLFYLETYVARMFCDWAPFGGLEGASAVFEVLIKDPAPDPSVPEAGAVAAVWELSPLPLVSQDITILNNMITQGKPCAKVTEIKPTWLSTAFPMPAGQLQPLKLYTAIFNLRFKRQSDADFVQSEELRYGFQTSRYASFADQVNSYKLKVDPVSGAVLKAAVFEVSNAFAAADIAVAASVLEDTMPAGDPLRQAFADPFNRLLEGALKLEAIHPPTGTEFNIVRDTASGRVLGMVVKSPEPFNDPKIPAADAASTIRLSVNGGDTALYKCVFSKDLSQAFVTNSDNSMSLPAGGTLDFTFDYKQWDGSAYTPVDTAAVHLVLP